MDFAQTWLLNANSNTALQRRVHAHNICRLVVQQIRYNHSFNLLSNIKTEKAKGYRELNEKTLCVIVITKYNL